MSNELKTRTKEEELLAIGRLWICSAVDGANKGQEIDYKKLRKGMDMIANTELVWGMLSAIDLGVGKNLITEDNALKLIEEIKKNYNIASSCIDK